MPTFMAYVILALAVQLLSLPLTMAGNFTLSSDSFLLNNKPHPLYSGSLHYSRVPPSLWSDRLDRLQALGLNTVQTYVPWNYHETDFEGTFDFTSPDKNLVKFLQLCKDRDMLVLLRPGPYICGEWDFGGFPARLLADEDMKLRTNDPAYMAEVTRFWDTLLPLMKPMLIENDGPIAMIQVENEFGSFGDVSTNSDDADYMHNLISLARSHLGSRIQLYTTDGGSLASMQRGSLEGDVVLTIGDFGPGNDIQASIDGQSKMNPADSNPLMCTEYYTGWLTHWGEDIASTSTQEMIATMQEMLDANMSFSLYMANGGTSFGYWAGANGGGGDDYTPDITSYDYNSPISEHGAHNVGSDGLDKFKAIQNLLNSTHDEPPQRDVMAYGEVKLEESMTSFVDVVKQKQAVSEGPLKSFEQLGARFGFVLYSFVAGEKGGTLELVAVRDRAFVYVGGSLAATVERGGESELDLVIEGGATVDILVENLGRIGFGGGEAMYDWKGLGSVMIGGEEVESAEHRVSEGLEEGSGFRGSWEIAVGDVASTFVDTSSLGQGFVWVNGFNLGKFWTSKGPTQSLWVPDEALREGKNEIVVLELEGGGDGVVTFVDAPVLN